VAICRRQALASNALDVVHGPYRQGATACVRPTLSPHITAINRRSSVNQRHLIVTAMFPVQKNAKTKEVQEVAGHNTIQWNRFYVRYVEISPNPFYVN